jgi:ribosomal protein S3AE
MNLTKSSKKQSMNLKFRVIEVHEGKGMTKPTDFLLQAASIKRLVRAGRDRVDDSFLIKTKDDQYAKVKPLLITKSHQPASVQTRLRLQAVQFVRKYVQVLTYDAFMKDLVEGKMQKELRERLGKITPLRNVEIRAVEYLDNFTPRRKIEFIEETPQPAADEE